MKTNVEHIMNLLEHGAKKGGIHLNAVECKRLLDNIGVYTTEKFVCDTPLEFLDEPEAKDTDDREIL